MGQFKTQTEVVSAIKKFSKTFGNPSKPMIEPIFIGAHNAIDQLAIYDEVFTSLFLDGAQFDNLKFERCRFENCLINHSRFSTVSFIECNWQGGELMRTILTNCEIISTSYERHLMTFVSIYESDLRDVSFNKRCELAFVDFNGDGKIENVVFNKSEVSRCEFEMLGRIVGANSYKFIRCSLHESLFLHYDLTNTRFRETKFIRTIFTNCLIGLRTISTNCSSEDENYSSIDLHTINNSEPIHPTVLEKVFGITEPDIKGYANGLTRKVELQSAFISYSFRDKEFASKLNHALMMKGVVTFLWEKDAPGGQPLRKIMSENVHKHERLIFIASENSIKSEACQYELTQGREQQDKDWTTILFPIHIDGYLFKVTEDDIRPREKRPEYWKNIQELRDINSTDFSAFNKPRPNKDAFDKAISKLVKDLRKDRSKE